MGKILVVDDEPHLRRILVSNLKQESHEIAEAASVGEARRVLAESGTAMEVPLDDTLRIAFTEK